MIQNRFRQKLKAGQCSIGVITFPSPETVEFCGLLGFDWVFIDGEHNGIGVETCQTLVRAAHSVGMGVMVRVPNADPSTMLGYLETGAFTVTVPHIATAVRARAAVAAGRYPPLGIRGAGSGTRSANYGLTQTSSEYFAQANKEVLIVPQFEDAEAIERIDEILAVPEVEALLIGPGDLAASMGYPGQGGHPEVVKVVDMVIRKAKAAGKIVGTTAGTPAAVRALAAKNADFALCSANGIFGEAARKFLSEARAPSS
ncbi:MAG: host specificity protein [Armatimonadetes bacterium]|nr:host specificity protein [Armatimonadota bacterium]